MPIPSPSHAAASEPLRGVVQSIRYSAPGFTVGHLKPDDGWHMNFVSPFPLQVGDRVQLQGHWEKDPRFGPQFRVEQALFEQPTATSGLAEYLARSPRFVGIGPARARKLVERFGDAFEQVVLERPEALREVLTEEQVKVLREEWVRTRELNQTMVWLAGHGLTPHQISAVIETFGNRAVAELKKQPYALVGQAAGFGFKRVDEIALRVGTPKGSPDRIRAALLYLVREQAGQGHCWVEFADLVEQAVQTLFLDQQDAWAVVEGQLHALLDEGELDCLCSSSRILVSQPWLLECEQALYRRFTQIAGPNPHWTGLPARPPPELNARQREAFELALRDNMVVISGGAGSGKTYTQRAIAEHYQALGLRVALCAPTGKAAKRLEQVVKLKARTIHRLLEFNGDEFVRNEENPLQHDVVIVDEVSMVDVPLAAALFRAIVPGKTAVVLVGDHHQLPPVGAGNLLRDLIDRRFLPTVVLDQVVRQAGPLKANSLAILEGRVQPTQPLVEGKSPWVVVSNLTEAEKASAYVENLFEKVLKEKLGFDLLQDVQLLTPRREGPLSVDEFNRSLQRLIQRKLWGVVVPPVAAGRRPRLLVHDKVLQTRNNYELGVMNGAIGTVLKVGDGLGGLARGDVRVQFEDREIHYKAEDRSVQELELAYALTIHKFQGSEVRCAVVVLHKSHAFMHHRNLFYTAVTRAKEMAIVVGDAWGIRHCAEVEQVEKRKTYLSVLTDDGDLE